MVRLRTTTGIGDTVQRKVPSYNQFHNASGIADTLPVRPRNTATRKARREDGVIGTLASDALIHSRHDASAVRSMSENTLAHPLIELSTAAGNGFKKSIRRNGKIPIHRNRRSQDQRQRRSVVTDNTHRRHADRGISTNRHIGIQHKVRPSNKYPIPGHDLIRITTDVKDTTFVKNTARCRTRSRT